MLDLLTVCPVGISITVLQGAATPLDMITMATTSHHQAALRSLTVSTSATRTANAKCSLGRGIIAGSRLLMLDGSTRANTSVGPTLVQVPSSPHNLHACACSHREQLRSAQAHGWGSGYAVCVRSIFSQVSPMFWSSGSRQTYCPTQ